MSELSIPTRPSASLAGAPVAAPRAGEPRVRRAPGRHRFACFHVVATFALLVAGAAVTSNDAGLAVVDWPTSLGFLNPLAIHLRGLMEGLVAFEHGHREVAMFVGLLTIVLCVWLWRTAEGPGLRRLGVALLALVCVQGALGGLTVHWKLPIAVSVAHGMIAQGFFCLSIAAAYVSSDEWARAGAAVGATASRGGEALALERAARHAFGAVAGQLLLGAIVRHGVAKWRVPTFFDLPVVLHMLFALVVLAAIGRFVARAAAAERADRRIVRLAFAAAGLLAAQILLGLLSVATRTDPLVTVLHVITGAAILGTTFLAVLRCRRLPEAAGA